MNLFDVFTKRPAPSAVEDPYNLYMRDGKPVALQGWVFSEAAISAIGETLRGSGLSWIWESTRTGPPLSVDDDVSPEHRSRQQVVDATLPVLQLDLAEKNLHGFRRFVALYGGTDGLLGLRRDDDLREAVEAFASGKESVVKALIVQMGDVAADVVYFDYQNKDSITGLLAALGLPALDSVNQRSYRQMDGEDLETVMSYLSCAEHDH